MPIRLSQVQSVPDILSVDRYELRFGPIPNAGDWSSTSSGPYGLLLKQAHITPPEVNIGQVRVPMFNHARAFRGHRDIGNQFSAEFYEDVRGGTAQTLFGWMEAACAVDTDDSVLQNDYAVDGELVSYDTTGQAAMTYTFEKAWPMTIRIPEGVEESGPALFQVVFSVDYFDYRFKG